MNAATVRANLLAGKTCGSHSALGHGHGQGHDREAASPLEEVEGDVLGGQHTGAVRASLGLCSSWSDCERLIAFLERTYVDLELEKAREGRGVRIGHPDGDSDLSGPTLQERCQEVLDRTGMGKHDDGPEYMVLCVVVYPVKSCAGESTFLV